jgi:putative transcriptional regulator
MLALGYPQRERKVIVKNRIRELRRARKMTQEELCQRAKVTRVHIWSLEYGKSVPGLDTAKRIADVLGVTVDDLLVEDADAA